jgi:hypothetical protein
MAEVRSRFAGYGYSKRLVPNRLRRDLLEDGFSFFGFSKSARKVRLAEFDILVLDLQFGRREFPGLNVDKGFTFFHGSILYSEERVRWMFARLCVEIDANDRRPWSSIRNAGTLHFPGNFNRLHTGFSGKRKFNGTALIRRNENR